MKKLYSTIMMLAMMVAALSFAACGGDDEDDGGGGNISSGSCFIEVSFGGKTYKETISDKWAYAQIDPVGTDDQNKKLTYTYDMTAHFEDTKGFLFMYGIVHYRNKADLLASPTGSYGCAKDILDDSFYNNLTFSPLFEIDGDEYEFINGTHQVKSIKKINNDVYVEGSFTAVFTLDGDTRNLSGSYKMLIP